MEQERDFFWQFRGLGISNDWKFLLEFHPFRQFTSLEKYSRCSLEFSPRVGTKKEKHVAATFLESLKLLGQLVCILSRGSRHVSYLEESAFRSFKKHLIPLDDRRLAA